MSVAAWSLLLATGCSNKELVQQTEGQPFTLEVGVGTDSRTYNDEEGHCNWGENESIYVFSEDGKSDAVLTLIRKNGKTATFAGTVNGNASKLKYTVYLVPNAEGKISMAKVNGKNHNAPMYGTIEGSGAKLEYAGGLVKLDINGAGDGTFKAEGSNNSTTKVIGGHYEFNTTDKKLVFVPGSSIVEITNIPSDGVVFLPIATDAASNAPEPVEVTLTTPEGNTIKDDVVVAKGASTQSEENSFPELKYNEVNGLLEINKISNFNELKDAFANGGAYRLMKDINATETLISNNTLFLDLNGYELKGNIVNNGNLTIEDNKIPDGKRNLEDVLTITMGGNDAQLNMNNNAIGSIRINNTVLSSKLNLPNNHEYIVYYEHDGDSNLYTWYSLNINANNKIINTFVIGEGKTFTFDNANMTQLILEGVVATPDELEDVVKAYFSEYSKYLTRLELKNRSKLQVTEHNSEAASGYATVVAEGDVTIAGCGKDISTLYLCGGSNLVIKKNSEVHVNNITIGVGNNGDGSFRAHVIPAKENLGEGDQWGKIITSNSYIWTKEVPVTETKKAKIDIASEIIISTEGQ